MRTVLIILALLGTLAGGDAVAQVNGASAAAMISKFRTENGLGRVTTDTVLTRIAQDQANAMAAKDVLDHAVLGSFTARVAPARAGYAAENIAYGYDDFPRTLDQWTRSSGHRANLLLKDGSRVGVAQARSAASGRTYWAMVIGGGYEGPPTMAAPKTRHSAASAAPCRVSLLGLCL